MKKNVNLEKRNKIIIAIIIIAIIIAIAVCVVVAFNLKNMEYVRNLNSQEGEELLLDGQIDYTKVENVNLKNNVKENNSKALLKEKNFEDMKVKEISLVASNGTTKFSATIENTSSNDFKNQKIVIIFKNKDGSEFARLNTYLGDIKVGNSAEINATTTSDYSNAYDFVIEKVI